MLTAALVAADGDYFMIHCLYCNLDLLYTKAAIKGIIWGVKKEDTYNIKTQKYKYINK